MPGGDKTGPAGAGPRTGRAMGICAGYEMPGYANRPGGRGRGMRMARGNGRGGGFDRGFGWSGAGISRQGNITADQQIEFLKQQVNEYEIGIDRLKKQIDELSG